MNATVCARHLLHSNLAKIPDVGGGSRLLRKRVAMLYVNFV